VWRTENGAGNILRGGGSDGDCGSAISTFDFHSTLGIGRGLVSLIIAEISIVTILVAMFVAWGRVLVKSLDVLRYE
jgi:uncharacterized membrane protein